MEVPFQLEAYRLPEPNQESLRELFTLLGFTRLIKSQLTTQTMEKQGFTLVQSEAALQEVVAKLKAAKSFAFDTETDSLDSLAADLVGISLCIESDQAFYIPLGHKDERGSLQQGQLATKKTLKALAPFWGGKLALL